MSGDVPPPRLPVLSLCVCTYNGAERIEDTLWSLICQTADPDAFEIVVVDNGSDDLAKLHALVERLRSRFGKITLVVERKLGLSHARNRAVDESRGDYVFFIDDDAIANPRLVEHLLGAISERAPDVLGGNVLPMFGTQPPPEMDGRYWPWWSLKHFGGRDRWLADGEYFLGTNVAAARRVLEENPFDTRLGRSGSTLRGGEDWYLGGSQFRRRFVSGAFVFHRVGPERQSVSYLARRLRGVSGPVRRGAGTAGLVSAVLRLIGRELALAVRRIRLAAAIRLASRKDERPL